eukprot:366553-Chlamydomonas_euryale.AAC.5
MGPPPLEGGGAAPQSPPSAQSSPSTTSRSMSGSTTGTPPPPLASTTVTPSALAPALSPGAAWCRVRTMPRGSATAVMPASGRGSPAAAPPASERPPSPACFSLRPPGATAQSSVVQQARVREGADRLCATGEGKGRSRSQARVRGGADRLCAAGKADCGGAAQAAVCLPLHNWQRQPIDEGMRQGGMKNGEMRLRWVRWATLCSLPLVLQERLAWIGHPHLHG